MRSIPRALLALGLVGALAAVTPAPAQAELVRPAAAYSATLSINKTSIDAGEAVVLSGKVKPAAKGIVVKLQKRLVGKDKWVNETTLRTKANGGYSYTDKPNTGSQRSYRVVVPATKQHAQGVSKSVKLTVYKWQDLTQVAARDGNFTTVQTNVTIDGTRYERAFAGYTHVNSGFVDWNFARRCTSLKARFGNGDQSADNANATIELVVDGDSEYTSRFALTQSQEKTFDVTGAFRVAFKWTSDNADATPPDTSGAQAAMVSPMVRCSF